MDKIKMVRGTLVDQSAQLHIKSYLGVGSQLILKFPVNCDKQKEFVLQGPHISTLLYQGPHINPKLCYLLSRDPAVGSHGKVAGEFVHLPQLQPNVPLSWFLLLLVWLVSLSLVSMSKLGLALLSSEPGVS